MNRIAKHSEKTVKVSVAAVTLISQGVLFLAVFIFILFTILTLGREVREKYENQQKANLNEKNAVVLTELSSKCTDIYGLAAFVSKNTDIQSLDPVKNWSARYNILQEMISLANKSSSVGYLFVRRPDSFYLGKSSDVNYYKYIDVHAQVIDRVLLDHGEEGQEKWMILSSEGVDYLVYYLYYRYLNVYIGMVNRVDVIYKDLLDSVSGCKGTIILTDGNGQELVLKNDGEKGTEFSLNSGKNSLNLCGTIYDSEIDGMVRRSMLRTILIGSAGILTIIMFAVSLYGTVIKKLIRLSRELKPSDRELDHVEITCDSGLQEIYELQSSAKYLIQEIVASRMQEYERQIQNDNLELLTLRSQIRPHFYLNAITTIDSLNFKGKKEEIGKFLQALAVHIRYMLRTDLSEIRLHEEVEHIRAYIAMQEIRYPERVVSYLEVDPEVRNNSIPHLILYTIIENIFKYALRSDDTLVIMLSARREDDKLLILIEDNGEGFPEAVLQEFADTTPEHKDYHIGLTNARKTLRLLYGKSGSFHIYNHEPHGSSVEIRIPIDRSEVKEDGGRL